MRTDQQVEREAAVGYGAQPGDHSGLGQPVGVGLVLRRTAKSGEMLARRVGEQPVDALAGVRGAQVDVADDAEHERRTPCQMEEFVGLLRRGDGLHHDAPSDPVGLGLADELVDVERPGDRRHRRTVDPRLFAPGQVPDVMVAVDASSHGVHAGPLGNRYSSIESGSSSAPAPGAVGAT